MAIKLIPLLLFQLFIVVSCKPAKQTSEASTEEVIIQFYDNQQLTKVTEDFKAFDLVKLKTVSKPLFIYLFQFNNKKIALDSLIKQLKTSPYIKQAQPNRNIQIRN